MNEAAYDIVVPTIGRPSLEVLLRSLAVAGARPRRVVVADDPTRPEPPLAFDGLPFAVEVVRSGGQGPAHARNVGVRAIDAHAAPWVVLLDDDVRVGVHWSDALMDDLRGAAPEVAAVQGRIVVPLPTGRPTTDHERQTAALETAWMVTADLAVRREAFVGIGGFDPQFRSAYREDSDFALRLITRGWRLTAGTRCVYHPPRPETLMASVAAQRGNRAHALMRQRHGPNYRRRIGETRRDLWPFEVTTTLLLARAVVALWLGQPPRGRRARRRWALWAVVTLWLTKHRVRPRHHDPGRTDKAELVRMVISSAVLPPVAVWHRALGWVDVVSARVRPAPGPPCS